MTRKLLRPSDPFCAVMALALLLAGCASEEYTRNQERLEKAFTSPPTSYRADITAFMHTYLNNPSGVKDAFVSEPAIRTFDSANRYASCVRYNAHKGNGQYAGSKDSLVLFTNGRLDRIVDNAREMCKDAAYQPFQELEQMSR